MDRFNTNGMSKNDWIMSSATVIDYHHQPVTSNTLSPYDPPAETSNLDDRVKLQLHLLGGNKQDQPAQNNIFNRRESLPSKLPKFTDKYSPFVEDDIEEDMDISDDESPKKSAFKEPPEDAFNKPKPRVSKPIQETVELKSGASFYKGLILYIPPFEQLANTYRGSPAMKMLFASFEFSFKMAIKIEAKQRENDPSRGEATVMFKDHVIASGGGPVPHVEACIRALELLSETCYTIQAKEDYFVKCKIVDGENMKTLNLKKWEYVSQKYPKLTELTKESHIQKTFAVFLDAHTSPGTFEDIVCCNLTRANVNSIKCIVEFFNLTMLPCSVSTNMSKKNTPCVVSIHKYTSAQKLMDILVACGGENDKFKLHPPDTFKDFYKLHQHYWDRSLEKEHKKIVLSKTTLDDDDLQQVILKPYENIISELFEKHKSIPKENDPKKNDVRKVGDDFMKETLKIDMAGSKNKAPVERMQLLLKYMEQLQEYGSRVLTSGRQEMIKIYHNAIDNLRKDLDECRKDIEKEQNQKDKKRSSDQSRSNRSKSPVKRRRTPPRRRSKSPVKRRSISPRRRPRSRSPKRPDSTKRRSISPKRPRRSPPRRSPPRRPRSPVRRAASPVRRPRSPRPRSPPVSASQEDRVFVSIFTDQFRRFVDTIRKFRIEVEDTPLERRDTLKDRLIRYKDQLEKFHREATDTPELEGYLDEIDILKDELKEQTYMIDMPRPMPGPQPPPAANWAAPQTYNYNPAPTPYPLSTSYPLPSVRPYNPPTSFGIQPSAGPPSMNPVLAPPTGPPMFNLPYYSQMK